MKRIAVIPLLISLAVAMIALAGCRMPATNPVTPTPSGDDFMLTQMAEMGSEALTTTAQQPTQPVSTPTPEPTQAPTQPPTVEPTEQPTAEPTEQPTVEPTPEPTPAPTEEPTEAPPSGETTYVVQPGDNLFRIALRYGMRFEDLAAYNNITNPSQIYPGQVIRIPAEGVVPPPQEDILYTVQPGDNLFRIALRYNMSYIYLASYNGISPPYYVYVGQVIRIPVNP